jgi:hypothetical protein
MSEVLAPLALALLGSGCTTDGDAPGENSAGLAGGASEELAFKTAKLLIEHNATDEDTGFQGFLDGEPWERVALSGPGGTQLSIQVRDELRGLGLTELFFETNEPENAEVPIDEVLAVLPAGEYEYEGWSIEGQRMEGSVVLTHSIPAGPEITAPAEGAVVDPADLTIRWNAVTQDLDGAPVAIAGYEVIVEKDLEALGQTPPANGFARQVLDVRVAPGTTALTIPRQFLEDDTPYKFEVLALEASGNQTLSSSSFETM